MTKMSVVFEGVEVPTACCFVDGEHSVEYCRFYNICKQRETIKTNYKPSDCPVKALEQEPVLDKIRAEILEKCFDVPYKNQAFEYGLKILKWCDVSEIIDKYKTKK